VFLQTKDVAAIGSQTFEHDIARLINEGTITREEGLIHADSPTNLLWRLQNETAPVSRVAPKKEEPEALKEEVISQEDVLNQNLVRKGANKKPDMHHAFDEHNYYLRVDEKIVEEVEDYGFPRPYILKCLSENVNNHCTTSYYLLCMDQNY